MLTCLLYLLLWVIVALIVLFVIEKLISMFIPDLDPRVIMLVRLFVGLLVLIWVLNCLGVVAVPLFTRPVL